MRNPATPEEIWAILREVSKKQEKSHQETEKIKKLIAETARRQEEADRQHAGHGSAPEENG